MSYLFVPVGVTTQAVSRLTHSYTRITADTWRFVSYQHQLCGLQWTVTSCLCQNFSVIWNL